MLHGAFRGVREKEGPFRARKHRFRANFRFSAYIHKNCKPQLWDVIGNLAIVREPHLSEFHYQTIVLGWIECHLQGLCGCNNHLQVMLRTNKVNIYAPCTKDGTQFFWQNVFPDLQMACWRSMYIVFFCERFWPRLKATNGVNLGCGHFIDFKNKWILQGTHPKLQLPNFIWNSARSMSNSFPRINLI